MTEPRHALVDDEVDELKRRIAELEGSQSDQPEPVSYRQMAQIAFWSIFGILVLLSLLYIVYQFGYNYEMSKLHDIPGVKPYEVTP